MRLCKDEWRKYVSPTCPGPRSAHAAVATSTGGGKLFLFGMVLRSPLGKHGLPSKLCQVENFRPSTRTVSITIEIFGASTCQPSRGIA